MQQKDLTESIDTGQFTEFVGDPKIWYVFREDRHFGPFTIQWLQEFIEIGALTKEHFVWKPGLGQWTPVDQFENFRAYMSEATIQNMSDLEFENLLRAEQFREEDLEVAPLPYRWGARVAPAAQVVERTSQIKENAKYLIERANVQIQKLSRKQKIWGAGIASVVIAATILMNMNFRYSSSEHEAYELLQSAEKSIANEISSAEGAKLALLPAKDASHFVVAISPEMAKQDLEVNLVGVRGSLVGIPNFKAQLRVRKPSRLQSFFSDRVSLDTLPSGKYYIQWKCKSCTDKTVVTGESEVVPLLKSEPDLYQQKLQNYKGAYVAQAQLEKDELRQLHRALQQHFDFTIGEFARINRSKDSERVTLWKRHTPEWQDDQSEFKKIFASLADPQFLNQLVYRDVYLTLSQVSVDIGRLQYLHSQMFENQSVKEMSQATMLGDRLQQSLNELKTGITNLGNEGA